MTREKTGGTRDDPERKWIMTPSYLHNTRPVHVLRGAAREKLSFSRAMQFRRKISVETPSADRRTARVARLQPQST